MQAIKEKPRSGGVFYSERFRAAFLVKRRERSMVPSVLNNLASAVADLAASLASAMADLAASSLDENADIISPLWTTDHPIWVRRDS